MPYEPGIAFQAPLYVVVPSGLPPVGALGTGCRLSLLSLMGSHAGHLGDEFPEARAKPQRLRTRHSAEFCGSGPTCIQHRNNPHLPVVGGEWLNYHRAKWAWKAWGGASAGAILAKHLPHAITPGQGYHTGSHRELRAQ